MQSMKVIADAYLPPLNDNTGAGRQEEWLTLWDYFKKYSPNTLNYMDDPMEDFKGDEAELAIMLKEHKLPSLSIMEQGRMCPLFPLQLLKRFTSDIN